MKPIISAVFLIIISSLNEGFVFADNTNIFSRPGGCPEGRPCPRPPKGDGVTQKSSGNQSPNVKSGHDVTILYSPLPPLELPKNNNNAIPDSTPLNGDFCCDSRGKHRCPIPIIPYSLAIGSPCLCPDQGTGVVCN